MPKSKRKPKFRVHQRVVNSQVTVERERVLNICRNWLPSLPPDVREVVQAIMADINFGSTVEKPAKEGE